MDGTAPAADIRLSEADLAEIDAILSDAMPVWGPGGTPTTQDGRMLDDNLRRYLITREELMAASAARVGRNLQDTEVVVLEASSALTVRQHDHIRELLDARAWSPRSPGRSPGPGVSRRRRHRFGSRSRRLR